MGNAIGVEGIVGGAESRPGRFQTRPDDPI